MRNNSVMSRAQRRADAARLKKNRATHGYEGRKSGLYVAPKVLGKRLHTAANCSCHMCGNPRKYDGERTVQERAQSQVPLQDLLNGG